MPDELWVPVDSKWWHLPRHDSWLKLPKDELTDFNYTAKVWFSSTPQEIRVTCPKLLPGGFDLAIHREPTGFIPRLTEEDYLR